MDNPLLAALASAPAAPSPRSKIPEWWEMLEAEFVAARWQERRAMCQHNITFNTEALNKLNGATRAVVKRRADIEFYTTLWTRDLAASETACPEVWAKGFRAQYVALVKKAISTGKPVPEVVIAQYPEFTTAATARARYNKGRHTSFAARSVAVDDTLLETRGFSVKRQDGKPIPEMQVADIARGMAEIEAVIGGVSDILRARGLTIAHTNGKHPFLSKSAGQYDLNEKTISTGIESALFKRPIPSLAHEFGHWLDYAAGEKAGVSTRVYAKSSRYTSYPSTALSEADCYRGLEDGLIRRARNRFYVSRYEIENRLKLAGDKLKALSPEEHAEFEAQKFILGAYWYEPREIFARLFEQYIASQLAAQAACTGNAHPDYNGQAAYAAQLQPARAVWSVYPDYTTRLAYWGAVEWLTFGPQVANEIQRRLNLLRGVTPG